MNSSVIVTGLSKTYGTTLALDKLSFTVKPGSIFGLIGPNGAGKTTSLAILAGLIQPTSGTAWIQGMQVRPGNRSLSSKIGFSSPQFPFFDYLTGIEVLLMCGLMHGLASQKAKSRTSDLLELLDLESAAGQFIYQFSQGMRQKLGLACALVHAPEVLLLDEPFAGLDPTSVYRLLHCFRQIATSGRTIILSSHDMALIERLCHRVGILHRGVLKREIELVSVSDRVTPNPSEADSNSRLESLLWEVVGAPEIKALTWI